MKYLFLLCLLFAGLSVPVLAQKAGRPSIKALDDKNGFRDLTFGASIADLPAMQLAENDGATQVYKRSADELHVGGAELSSVYYLFYKERLSSVMLETKGLSNSRALLDALQATFGPGFQSNEYIQDFYWGGKIATMSYSENSISNDATVFIRNVALAQSKETDNAAAAKKAKSDL